MVSDDLIDVTTLLLKNVCVCVCVCVVFSAVVVVVALVCWGFPSSDGATILSQAPFPQATGALRRRRPVAPPAPLAAEDEQVSEEFSAGMTDVSDVEMEVETDDSTDDGDSTLDGDNPTGVFYIGAVGLNDLRGGGGGGKGQHKGKEPPPPPLSRPSEPLAENFEVIVAETMEEVLLYMTPAQAEAARLHARDGDYGATYFHNGNTLVHMKPLDRPAPIDQEIFR